MAITCSLLAAQCHRTSDEPPPAKRGFPSADEILADKEASRDLDVMLAALSTRRKHNKNVIRQDIISEFLGLWCDRWAFLLREGVPLSISSRHYSECLRAHGIEIDKDFFRQDAGNIILTDENDCSVMFTSDCEKARNEVFRRWDKSSACTKDSQCKEVVAYEPGIGCDIIVNDSRGKEVAELKRSIENARAVFKASDCTKEYMCLKPKRGTACVGGRCTIGLYRGREELMQALWDARLRGVTRNAP
jgi:hypothetical protein